MVEKSPRWDDMFQEVYHRRKIQISLVEQIHLELLGSFCSLCEVKASASTKIPSFTIKPKDLAERFLFTKASLLPSLYFLMSSVVHGTSCRVTEQKGNILYETLNDILKSSSTVTFQP